MSVYYGCAFLDTMIITWLDKIHFDMPKISTKTKIVVISVSCLTAIFKLFVPRTEAIITSRITKN